MSYAIKKKIDLSSYEENKLIIVRPDWKNSALAPICNAREISTSFQRCVGLAWRRCEPFVLQHVSTTF